MVPPIHLNDSGPRVAHWIFCPRCGWQTPKPNSACANTCCGNDLHYADLSQADLDEMERDGLTVKELVDRYWQKRRDAQPKPKKLPDEDPYDWKPPEE
ncbi:hypothetical protein LCGC14_0164190 [marine sediment metagenome]|uniref:Uncharacterized protein n=1 Tax=marine sediment metagenome TaxID=412755 RepID=A0A0F9UUQ1_9ZZZZ